jgi:hypothetical protein
MKGLHKVIKIFCLIVHGRWVTTSVNNKDTIKKFWQNMSKTMITYKVRVYDLYKRNKKRFLFVLIIAILASILTYPIKNCCDEFQRNALLEMRNKQYSVKAVDELVYNIRTVQFYYWCFKKAWTAHGDYNGSAKDTYKVFLQEAALMSKASYYVEAQSELDEAYDYFRRVNGKLKKIIPDDKKYNENVYIDDKTYLDMMKLMKISIDKGINVAKIICDKRDCDNYLGKSYMKADWCTDDNLAANGNTFLKTAHATRITAESGAGMLTLFPKSTPLVKP